MNDIVIERLKSYKALSLDDERQALREIIQELALLALWRAKFFEHAAFYGGSALRILYGLNRFSEDLDFALSRVNKEFRLKSYQTAIKSELLAFGFEVEIETKEKVSTIESAFIKANTLQQLIKVKSQFKTHKDEKLTVKFEVDTDPAFGFVTAVKQFFWPFLFSVTTCDASSLFAGKIHAIICRERVRNIKGRDWYDFLWYIGRKTPVNLNYLEQKLRQSGIFNGLKKLSIDVTKDLLLNRIETLDVEAAKKDIERFIRDKDQLNAWSKESFKAAVDSVQSQL